MHLLVVSFLARPLDLMVTALRGGSAGVFLGSFPYFFLFFLSVSLFHSLNPLLIPDSLSPQHCQFRHLRACALHLNPLPKKFAAIYHFDLRSCHMELSVCMRPRYQRSLPIAPITGDSASHYTRKSPILQISQSLHRLTLYLPPLHPRSALYTTIT